MQCAQESKLALRHGAILFDQSGKQVLQTSCNGHGHKIFGYDVPSLHAEANCLRPIHQRLITGRGKKCRERPSDVLREWDQGKSCFKWGSTRVKET
jgi:hypothetical protein